LHSSSIHPYEDQLRPAILVSELNEKPNPTDSVKEETAPSVTQFKPRGEFKRERELKPQGELSLALQSAVCNLSASSVNRPQARRRVQARRRTQACRREEILALQNAVLLCVVEMCCRDVL